MTMGWSAEKPLRVGLAGFGTVGRWLAERLAAGAIPAARLAAISARDLAKAEANSRHFSPPPLVLPVAELPRHADAIVECATGEALPEIATAALGAGRILIPVSVGALAAHPEILDLAGRHGGRLKLATGALPGLDAIRCAAEGHIRSVKLTSRILPGSLAHERYLLDRGYDFSTPPAEPVRVFQGTAREAAAAFPRHFNVAAALSLAGVGFERTEVEVWADAGIEGAVHNVTVDADDIRLDLTSRNRPSETNPRTSRAVGPSVLAALRSLVAPVQVGS
jgi:aspartate dehydrogenase